MATRSSPSGKPRGRNRDGRKRNGRTDGRERHQFRHPDRFNKCIVSTQRVLRYREGSYNQFLFTLGNKCFARGLDEREVKRMAALRYGNGGKWDTDSPIAKGYTYTGKTEKAAKRKEE